MNISIRSVDGQASVDYYSTLQQAQSFIAAESFAASEIGAQELSAIALPHYYEAYPQYPMTPQSPHIAHFENQYYANYSPYAADEQGFIYVEQIPVADSFRTPYHAEPTHLAQVFPSSPAIEQGFFDHSQNAHEEYGHPVYAPCTPETPQASSSDYFSGASDFNAIGQLEEPISRNQSQSSCQGCACGSISTTPKTPSTPLFLPYRRSSPTPASSRSDYKSLDRRTSACSFTSSTHLATAPSTPLQNQGQLGSPHARRKIPFPLRRPGDFDEEELAAAEAERAMATAHEEAKQSRRSSSKPYKRKARPAKIVVPKNPSFLTPQRPTGDPIFPSVLLQASTVTNFPSVLLSYDATVPISPPASPPSPALPEPIQLKESPFIEAPLHSPKDLTISEKKTGRILRFQPVNFTSTNGVVTKSSRR